MGAFASALGFGLGILVVLVAGFFLFRWIWPMLLDFLFG